MITHVHNNVCNNESSCNFLLALYDLHQKESIAVFVSFYWQCIRELLLAARASAVLVSFHSKLNRIRELLLATWASDVFVSFCRIRELLLATWASAALVSFCRIRDKRHCGLIQFATSFSRFTICTKTKALLHSRVSLLLAPWASACIRELLLYSWAGRGCGTAPPPGN